MVNLRICYSVFEDSVDIENIGLLVVEWLVCRSCLPGSLLSRHFFASLAESIHVVPLLLVFDEGHFIGEGLHLTLHGPLAANFPWGVVHTLCLSYFDVINYK